MSTLPEPQSAMRKASVRVGRFVAAVRPTANEIDRAVASEWLEPRGLALFLTQSLADQQHSVAVARLLLNQGHSQPWLVAAALLHDVGKNSAQFTPWHRTAITVLEKASPTLLLWLASLPGPSWLRPFAVHLRHAEAGARMAETAGLSQRTVELIRQHHTPSTDWAHLTLLQWADESA